MKYIIEIVSPTAFGEHALSRAVVECKDLVGAQKKGNAASLDSDEP
jgi:hypothetical protein